MGLKLVTPPEVEPVTLAEAKAHLRLETTADDAFVTSLIPAARELVEIFLRRALITQTWELTLDGFPWNRYLVYSVSAIDIPRPPLQSVEWIKYTDTAGQVQTMRPDQYVVDASSDQMGRVALAWTEFWPLTRYTINSVAIRFKAGYGDSPEDVPPGIRLAICRQVSDLYENREDVVIGQSVSLTRLTELMLWRYRALGVE